jgi:anti-sigma B factor antagonist
MVTHETRFSVMGSDSEAGVHIASLSGQLDAHTAPDLEKYLEHTIRTEGKKKVVLDFASLEYISSAGLGVLMGFIEDTREAGGDIKLAAVPEKIYHVLDLLGFPVVFSIVPTVAEAEGAFARG